MSAQAEVPRSSAKQVVELLRIEASNNACFKDVCHIFALRERARQQVTIASLTITMAKEGFKYSRDELAQVLKILAGLHIGYLDYDMKGRLRALKGIKVTLQSIGLAAISKKDGLDRYSLSPMFGKLPLPPEDVVSKAVSVKKELEKETPKRQERSYPASLVVTFETETVTFTIPAGITSKQLASMLSELYKKV